jgi:hypothetical protein
MLRGGRYLVLLLSRHVRLRWLLLPGQQLLSGLQLVGEVRRWGVLHM